MAVDVNKGTDDFSLSDGRSYSPEGMNNTEGVPEKQARMSSATIILSSEYQMQ